MILQATEIIKEPQMTQTRLKRKKRTENFRITTPLQKQLKSTNIFFQSPVIKIGYNMQFEQYLRFHHIQHIRPDHGGTICRNSIIFFLKDAPFNPNIISEKNQATPIALSIFPEFFDSKLSISHEKRKIYLQHMIDNMNGTYDPERMSVMPKYSNYPVFDPQQYFKTVQLLKVSNQANYKSQWIENIIKRLRLKLNQTEFLQILHEQWQFFNLANAMCTLDFMLKDPKIMQDLKISPYLNTRVITSRNILYHGGYCRSIYQSWSNYVDSSRKKLIPRMRKYHPITQAIYGWYVQFQDLQLYQNYFMGLLQQSINIDLFRKIQLSKIKYTKLVMRHIWFRGMLVIYHFNRLMMKEDGEYTHLVNYRDSLKEYIKEAKLRAKQLKNNEEINNFYVQFYDNFITSLHKESNIHSIQEFIPAFPTQPIAISPPQLSNLSVLLNIQLAKTIQKSFGSLKRQILDNNSQPILRLTLIIDRQSIKFLQQQQQIINSFIQIIKGIMHFTIQGFPITVNCDPPKEERKKPKAQKQLQNINTNQIPQNEIECFRQYPEIEYVHSNNTLQEQKKLKLRCKTSFNFDEDIKTILQKVKQYYQQCFGILDQFQIYLPFIKLTTAQKIFNEPEHTSLEHTFLRNLKIIAKYKESIRKLNKFTRINIFEVNCQVPIRILQERIDEIEYIMEQNYMNIIHDRIESMDADLNTLKLNVHNLTISMQNIDDVENRLSEFKQQIKLVHSKSMKIAEMVMFCLDNKRKIDTIITCYSQIVAKKEQLHCDIDAIGLNIDMRRPEIEAEMEQEVNRIISSIHKVLATINDMETTFFQFANLQQYLSNLRGITPQIDELYLTVCKCQQCSHIIPSSRHSLKQRMNYFLKQRERFALIIQYWQSFFNFATYYKQISKLQVLKINYNQFINNIEQSETVIDKIKQTEQQWWNNNNDKSQWKPIIHHTHDYYSKKFNNQVQLCRQLQQQMQILTNNKIKDRHWQHYHLEEFNHITFRELVKLEPKYKSEQLTQMNQEVNFEYAIYLQYQLIERQIRNHQLLIIDLNCSDVLDLHNLSLCLEFLYNIQIDIQNLMAKDINSYYSIELQELLKLTKTTHAKLQSWGTLQEKYIGLLQYHVVNEDYEHNLFEHLMDLHRKLVKSYDIDNSIIFISKNIVMDNYLIQIQDQLIQLDNKIITHLSIIRNEYPRLYLLNNKQLFTFMSADADIEHYLNKCFPHIHRFIIREGSIQKVGAGRDLSFTEPLYIQEMIGRVSTWMSTLEEMIKIRMKEFYKTNLILSEGKSTVELETNFYEKYPVQLAMLEQFSLFTELAEDAIITGHLQAVVTEMKDRIQLQMKEKKETWRILLFILLRDIANKLIQEEGLTTQSFQWTKYPRFYRKHNQFEPKMSILNQEYTYAFNFLQKNELIYTDNVLIGNCVVGSSKTGKTSLMKYYSYLAGQELLIFDPTNIDHEHSITTLLLNYFRVNIFAGNWLYLQRIDHLQDEQLKLVAQCIITIQQNLKLQNTKLTLNGHTFTLNKNARVFMSISSLEGTQLPARLCSQMRAVWVSPPNKHQLLEYYLQSKCVSSIQIGKIFKLCSWLDYHTEMQMELINWIRQEESIELFLNSLFYKRLIDWCIFKGSQCDTLLEALKCEQYQLNNIQYKEQAVDLQAEITIQKNRKLLVYGQSSTGKTYSILKSLKDRPFIIINAERYLTIHEFYQVVKCLQSTHIEATSIVLKHALPYYDLIRQHLRNYHLILVENKMNYLHMGLLHQLKLINYQQILSSTYPQQLGVYYNNLQFMLPRFFNQQEQTTDLYQLLSSPFTLFLKIINRLTVQLTQQYNINQLHINFIHILKIFINQQYQMCISFLFAAFWSYGFFIEQKKLEQIFKEVEPDNMGMRSKFQKINLKSNHNQRRITTTSQRRHEQSLIQLIREVFSNKLVPLIEMIPLKKGKFITSLQSTGLLLTLRQVQLMAGRKVAIKSNLIYNITTIRQNYKGTIIIDSRDWLTTILTSITNNNPNTHYYNFGNDSPSQIFQRILHKIKREDISYNFAQNTSVVIEDVYLCNDQTVNKLKDLVDYNFALFLTAAGTENNHTNKQSLQMYRISNVSFTLGSKQHYPTFTKGLNIRLQDVNITSLFNEYVQSFCENYLKVDRSVFCLLNLSNTINRIYKEQQNNKYFWFKNPLLLLQQTNLTNLTQFVQKYITYLIEVLPDEKSSLTANFTLLQLTPPTQYSPSVVNTTEKYEVFYNYSAIVQQLVNDHQIMEQIQSKQIESIFFDKFIKRYFTTDILTTVIKITNYVQYHHILLLSDQASNIERIIKYVCKINHMQFIQDHHRFQQFLRDRTKKTILFVDLDQISETFIQQIQTAIKSRDSTRIYNQHLRLVLKCSLNANKTHLYLQRYPFLKSHFLTILLQKDTSIQDVSETAITSSKNIIEEEIEADRYLLKLQQLTQLYNLDTNFKDEFMRTFELNRKKQLSKFQFYRKITSEMILNIDLINKCMADIPHILNTLTEKEVEMQHNKRNGNEEMQQLRVLLQKWEQKEKVYGQLIKYRYQEEEICLGKLNQATVPLFTRLDKLQKKIQAMQTIEFTRLKNNLRNNESIAITQPLHQVLISLDKTQNISKDKVTQQTNIIMNNPQSLVHYLKNIRKREDYQSPMHRSITHLEETIDNKRITSAMNTNRIKHFTYKMEELTDNNKKYEKVSPIYKPIMAWLTIFQTITHHLKEYYDKMDQIDNKIYNTLHQLSNKHGEEINIQQQMRSLEASVVDSENRVKDIRAKQKDINQNCRHSEQQAAKLLRLHKFYSERRERLSRIVKLLGECEYMKKISSSVSLYFKNIQHIIFGRTLIQLTLNEWLHMDSICDYQLIKGIFTFRVQLYSMKQKCNIQNTNNFEQVQVLYNLLQDNNKKLSLLEDRNGLIKNKLVELTENKNYHVKQFKYETYPQICKYILTHIDEHQRIVILHENVHHLELHRTENETNMHHMIHTVIENLKTATGKQVIYVTNYLPPISSEFYSQAYFGKIVVSRQRFISDMSDVLNVVLQREVLMNRQNEITKRRGDIEVIIGERNSKMKELMSNIEILSNSLSEQFNYSQKSKTQIEKERDGCQCLQNNLLNLQRLEEELQVMQKHSTNFFYQPANSRNIITQELQCYYWLYSYTDHVNNHTNNQFFAQREFYYQWLNLIKNIREEYITYFTRTQSKPTINQIVIRETGDQQKQKQINVTSEQKQIVLFDKGINPNFRKHNSEILNIIIEKLCKNTNWIQKVSLVQYMLGVCIILCLPSHEKTQNTIIDLLYKQNIDNEEINIECVRVLKLMGKQAYHGYEIRIDKLIGAFMADILTDNADKAKQSNELIIFIYLYLCIVCDQSHPKPLNFLIKFSEVLSSGKSTYSQKYRFVKLIMNLKLQNEIVLKLTPPLSLSLNFETKLNERERIVTIIEQQKYLIDDLIEVLKIKTLSKKREMVSILLDLNNKDELIQQLKTYYKSTNNKYWVYLSNLSVTKQNYLEVRSLLETVLQELNKLPPNPYLRIFIILEKQTQDQYSLYYNKYEVNKIKSYHQINNDEYYRIINQITLETLYDEKERQNAKNKQDNMGRQLVQLLINNTIVDHSDNITQTSRRLANAQIYYKSMLNQYGIFKQEDRKLFYKNFINEILRLGFLKGEYTEDNFYQYLIHVFKHLTPQSNQSIKEQIQIQHRFAKQGIPNRNIISSQEAVIRDKDCSPAQLEYINLTKIEEYFKNINSEFADVLRKQILINNAMLTEEATISNMNNINCISDSVIGQSIRNYHLTFALSRDDNTPLRPTGDCIKGKLPLLRLLNSLKLKQICNSKKVNILNSEQFYVFISAFMFKQIRQFMQQLQSEHVDTERRCSSSGFGQFVNFVSIRDLVTKMKIILIEVESYQQININEREISKVILQNKSREIQFVMGIRKCVLQKMNELNCEQQEVDKILQRYNMNLIIGGEIGIQLCQK